MSTRAQVRFATREEGVTFSEHPNAIHAQFYVHHDGYPEGLGLHIASSIMQSGSATSFYGEIESLDAKHGDLEYIYYIWQAPGKSTWISIFDVGLGDWCSKCKTYIDKEDECIFVGEPSNLIKKYGSQLDESYYKLNTNAYG
tara:strand:- start:17 stop:442 length:426 start_codon:yes stop_codon:yes gene_type:complete